MIEVFLQSGQYDYEDVFDYLFTTADADGHPTIELDNATLRFVEATDGRGEGLGGIDITAVDRDAILEGAHERDCYVSDDQVEVAGLRVYLR